MKMPEPLRKGLETPHQVRKGHDGRLQRDDTDANPTRENPRPWGPHKAKALFLVLSSSEMRIGEVLHLIFEDIDFTTSQPRLLCQPNAAAPLKSSSSSSSSCCCDMRRGRPGRDLVLRSSPASDFRTQLFIEATVTPRILAMSVFDSPRLTNSTARRRQNTVTLSVCFMTICSLSAIPANELNQQ